jgi:hypothetical protein
MKLTNRTHIEGLVYQHSLEVKTSGPNSANPGTEFISGNLDVATDDAGINIVTVHFTYVTATTKQGKPNATYNALKDIIDGKVGSVMGNGADKAGKVSIDSAIGLNEFYTDRNGKEELVSAKRNEGGFVHVVQAINEDEKTRNTFECDIVITNVTYVEADDEKQTAEKATVKGAIFDFRGGLLPVEFSVLNANAISYYLGLEASPKNPVFTKVKGRQISEVVVKQIVEESAFGEPSVREVKNTRKDYVITWGAQEPYAWDDESTMTAQQLIDAMAAREIYLAGIKQRQDEYKASKNAAPSAFNATGGMTYNF